eukprot:6629795-Pyramimonas_sp.AAC.1
MAPRPKSGGCSAATGVWVLLPPPPPGNDPWTSPGARSGQDFETDPAVATRSLPRGSNLEPRTSLQ